MTTPRRTDREAGQAMVEFALGAIAMFTILFAVMVFGHAFGKVLDLRGANNDAARRMAIESGNENAVNAGRQRLHDQLVLTDGADVNFTVTPGPPWNHGDEIVVRSSTVHELNVIGVTAWSGTIRAERRIRVE